MAREYAKIRTDIWGDEDFRRTSASEKLLYFLLLSHATLSYAGVADWRPARLAPLADESWSTDDVRAVAALLEAKHLIVTDDDREEVLVRSFIKYDGVMKQPRLAVSMATAFTAVASLKLRQVIAHEVQKLCSEFPDLACWGDARVKSVLEHSALNIKEFGHGLGERLGEGLPSVSAEFGPNAGQALVSPTTTTTTTSSKEDRAANRGTRVPEDFQINEAMREWAMREVPLVDLDKFLEPFKDYWRGVPGQKGVKRDWVGTWRNDMRKKQEFAERDAAKNPVRKVKRLV